ncbi:MAG: desulfoferrodoxin [Rectinemataceae bacterium]
MAELNQILKCASCGSILEVVHGSKCEPDCCGSTMKVLAENSTDASKEKHVPVIEKIAGGFKVSVGSAPHPMEEKHYIEWIELIADGVSYKAFLSPGMAPTAQFMVAASHVIARAYCNIHGLWRAEA